MRRTIAALALGWGAGLCMAAGAAYAYTLLDAWQGYGDKFQLGYVVGYLDAAKLAARHDKRSAVTITGAMPDFERWRALVNEYFADPANAKRSIPDGMAYAGDKLRGEWFKARVERMGPNPTSTPASGAAAAPTTAPH